MNLDWKLQESELSDDETIPFAKRVAKMIESNDAPDREAAIEKIRERRRKKVTEEKEERRAIQAKKLAEAGGVTIGSPLASDDEANGASGEDSDSDMDEGGQYYDSGSEDEASGSDVEQEEFFKSGSKKRAREPKKSKRVESESDSENSEDAIPRVLARAVWKKKPKTK